MSGGNCWRVVTAVAASAVLLLAGCNDEKGKTELRVFGADSLYASFKEIEAEFERLNPDVDLLIETHGSVMVSRIAAARGADVVALADHRLVEKVLSPKHTSWVAKFVTTEIVLAGTTASKYRDEINGANWFEILLRPDVKYGCATPSLDPCGYYTRITWALAEQHYFTSRGKQRALTQELIDNCPPQHVIRDANALVSEHLVQARIDYAFVYRTHAIDHRLPYVTLPKEINLGDASLAALYSKAQGIAPDYKGGTEFLKGAPIAYGVTVFDNTKHPAESREFVRFLLSEGGLSILERSQFRPLKPALVPTWGTVPEFLSDLAVPEKAPADAGAPK
ncbi:extracellular solute-binding protein [Planctomycetota bacterium]